MKKKIVALTILLVLLLTGCGNDDKKSLIEYNIALRDIKVIKLEKEEPYRGTHHYRIIGEDKKVYETTWEVYYDLEKIYNTYKLTNPKDVLTLDGIYDSQEQRIIDMAILPKN